MRTLRASNGSKLYQVYGLDGQLLFGWDTATNQSTNYVYLNGSLVARSETGSGSGTGPGIPEPPTATPNPSPTGAYRVSWLAVAGATRYELFEVANGGTETTPYSGGNTYWDASGKANGSYVYRVRACDASNICGGHSGTMTVTVQSAIPALTLSAPSAAGTYTASWTAVANATRYVLKQTPAGGSETTVYDGPDTSWPSPAKADGTYSYRVQACSGSCGNPSPPATVTVATPVPEGLQASPNPATANTTYAVSWQAVAGAVTYRAEEKSASATTWTALATSNQTSRAITGGKPVGTWSYRVRACRHATDVAYCGDWALVNQQVQAAPPGVPLAPLGLWVSPKPSTTGNYTVTWGDSVDAVYWEVDEKYQHDATGWHSTIASPTVRSWSPPTPKTGYGDYTYRVRACNALHQCSVNSSEFVAQVHIPGVLPEMPPSVGTITPNPSTTGTYTWTWPAAVRATSYRMRETAGMGAPWVDLPEQTGRSWSPPSPKVSSHYSYIMQGCNLYGCGPWATGFASVDVSIPTQLPMTVPRNFTIIGGWIVNKKMTFSWDVVAGAAEYQIKQELWDCAATPSIRKVGAAVPQPVWEYASLGQCGGHAQDPSR